jgi:hypothetical protein
MNHRRAARVSKQAASCFLLLWVGVSATIQLAAQAADPLPSWNDGAAKKAIIDFVKRTTTVGGPDFVPVEDRIAAFDSYGTLWTERTDSKCLYWPMMEVKGYLQSNGFKAYLVSGGGVESKRFLSRVYGLAPYFFGNRDKPCYENQIGEPGPLPLTEGLTVSIGQYICHYPIAAFANSGGDVQMLEWTAAGKKGKPLMVLLDHTDANHRQSSFVLLDKALAEANAKGWIVVDMKTDWKADPD